MRLLLLLSLSAVPALCFQLGGVATRLQTRGGARGCGASCVDTALSGTDTTVTAEATQAEAELISLLDVSEAGLRCDCSGTATRLPRDVTRLRRDLTRL